MTDEVNKGEGLIGKGMVSTTTTYRKETKTE